MRISYSKLAALVALLVVAYLTSAAVKTVPSTVGGAIAGYNRALVKHASHPLEDGSEPLARDPFAKPGELDGSGSSGEPAVKPGDLRLTGVVFSGRRRVAYIDGKRLHEGDRLGAFLVKRIEFNRVAVSDDSGTYDVWLNASSAAHDRPGAPDRPRAGVSATGAGLAAFPEVLADQPEAAIEAEGGG